MTAAAIPKRIAFLIFPRLTLLEFIGVTGCDAMARTLTRGR